MRRAVLQLELLTVSLLLCVGSGCRQTPPVQVTQLTRARKASVLVFLAPDCPLSQSYTATLNHLYSQFEHESVGFYGIVAGDDLSENELREFAGRYKLSFPVLLDHDFSLTNFFGATDNLHLVERYTRVEPDMIVYRVTVEDPTTFARPWTVAVPYLRTDEQMFEYACHEGNYGMEGILSGARAQEGSK